MIHPHSIGKRIYLSIGILSAAIIALQLVLMQILSIMQWYHFAYMVISIALLGFGAAGTFLSIFRKPLLRNSDKVLPILMFLSAIVMATVIGIAQTRFIRFDSYLLFADLSQMWGLVLTYFLFFTPFFFGALAIGLSFTKYVHHIGRLYFANLLGSGAGGIVALGLIWHFLPNKLPAIISILPLVAGLILMPKKSRASMIMAAATCLIIIIFNIIHPPNLVLSEFKDLTRALNIPEAKISLEKPSPYGLIQLVSSPALRYAPALSLSCQKVIPSTQAVFNNGDWFGPVISWNKADAAIMNYTTSALPYFMDKRDSVLILNAGTGMDILQAMAQGAKTITAVEANPIIVQMIDKELSNQVFSSFDHPDVCIRNIESRTYLLTDSSKYDLITLPIIGAFGGTSGLYALQEQYLLTKEAFREMWLRLTKDGVISITCWMDYPVRNPLKILSTIAEVLREQGIPDPLRFITAVRSWGTLTINVKRSPVSTEETQRIRKFCKKMFFDPAILPDIRHLERARFNALQDDQFFCYLDEILSSTQISLYSRYDFNIRPATDNRPYFSQFLRWKSLPHLAGLFGSHALPFLEIGYLIVALTLIQISIASVVLIILPLFSLGWNIKNKLRIVLYFSGIGLGYMFVEIVFIQHFILYFGNPICSAGAVISSMLICSGIGSYMSSKIKGTGKPLNVLLGCIAVLILLYAMVLPPILQKTIAFPFEIKFLLAFLFIAPVSFLMGMPFPAGISFLAQENQTQVPWAWGINGCLSVISAALATIIAVELGFVWVMMFASFAYLLPILGNIRKP